MSAKCWECEQISEYIHNHHPVPRSRGGTKTIPLCESCHAKAHHRHKNMNTSQLTREGLARARARGVKLGNPKWRECIDDARHTNMVLADKYVLEIYPTIDHIMQTGTVTYQGIADALNARGVKTRSRKRGSIFHPTTVKNILIRIKQLKQRDKTKQQAKVVELVYTADLKSVAP